MYLKQRFNDLDEMLESLVGWDLDFLPLERGRFPSLINQFLFRNTFLGEASFFRKVEQRGTTPLGYRTFVVPKDDKVSYHWRGHEISGNRLSLFPPGGELYSVSNGSFRVYTISFDEDIIEEALRIIRSTTAENALKTELVWTVSHEQMRRLRALIARLLIGSNDKPIFATYDTELELLTEILSSIQPESHLRPDKSKRDRALKHCIDLISSAPSTSSILSIKKLCLESKVSERTLQYAFSERYGLTPKEYIKNYNLRMVRRALKNRPHGSKIYSIAAEYGFWHMGQFAADYKKHFGELPSQTR